MGGAVGERGVDRPLEVEAAVDFGEVAGARGAGRGGEFAEIVAFEGIGKEAVALAAVGGHVGLWRVDG